MGGSPDTWRIAGSLRLEEVLARLSATRPVFHSEADFQHHLAWEMHLMDPALRIRLEVRPDPARREQVDLLVDRPDSGMGTAIELKYLKAAWQGAVGTEDFLLLNQGAQDISRYDVVKDVARVERFVAQRTGWNGYAIVVTNDRTYWAPRSGGPLTIDHAFRIHEGAGLAGERAWGAGAGDGTMRGRRAILGLRGEYTLNWRDYSHADGRNGLFRVLVVAIRGQSTTPQA